MTPRARTVTPAPTPTQALVGTYQLHPGGQPGITGQRPILQPGRLQHLLHGQPLERIPDVLGNVFTLCAHAHRRTSRQVLGLGTTQQDTPVYHLIETARDHLRSMALDWPQRLATPPSGVNSIRWLKDCPVPIAGPTSYASDAAAWAALAALRTWLEEHIVQADLNAWLTRHQDTGALTGWIQAHAGRLLPAHCLALWLESAPPVVPASPVLDVLSSDEAQQAAHLRALGADMATQVDFAQYPTWQGQCAENGPWTRLRHRDASRAPTLALRLASRWIDLLELAAASPTTSPAMLLSTGTLHLADGQTLAWCEMARGLLLHWVRRDVAGAVLDYKVIAPTEWNFHPQGALSSTLATLKADDNAAAQALAGAFDPCVACSV